MKLWKIGIRIYKGINDFKVYHFGSTVLRKKLNKISKNKYGSTGAKIFLIKWGITIKFFKKFYLRSDSKYENILESPKKNLDYYLSLIICKLNFIYIKLFNKKINKILTKNR